MRLSKQTVVADRKLAETPVAAAQRETRKRFLWILLAGKEHAAHAGSGLARIEGQQHARHLALAREFGQPRRVDAGKQRVRDLAIGEQHAQLGPVEQAFLVVVTMSVRMGERNGPPVHHETAFRDALVDRVCRHTRQCNQHGKWR